MVVEIRDGKVWVAPDMYLINPKTKKPVTEEEFIKNIKSN